MTRIPSLFDRHAIPWTQRMDAVVDTMRHISEQTEPEALVRVYTERMREFMPIDCQISLSRRDLERPLARVTRFSGWTNPPNPWRERERLPVLRGGLLGTLIHDDKPRLIDDLKLEPDDPAAEYLDGQRSIMAIPMFDRGAALNMVILGRKAPHAFASETFPEQVWMSNLFGRAMHALVLSDELKRAYEVVDHEMRVVSEIQRALLPSELPRIPSMDLAVHYQTSSQAGGDYYDFFKLPEGRWGLLIADVSGHGTPAAVLMAVTRGIAHSYPASPESPGRLLEYLNDRLFNPYTLQSGAFVTAFYGVYDPTSRELQYACAGHPPPRLKRCDDGTMTSLRGSHNIPLCVSPKERFADASHTLRPGDQIIFYTDGITEAQDGTGDMFGVERLDAVLTDCRPVARNLIDAVLAAVHDFTKGRPADDDRTLLVAKIR